MIFIGTGALLKHAVQHAASRNYAIDVVFSHSREIEGLCGQLRIPYRHSAGINGQGNHFVSADKVVFSINNGQILREPLLSLPGFRFYNIHNGILPAYRGLPEVCIVHALLNGEKEYGVSLHGIDEGVDSGPCYDIEKFPLTETDTFQSVILRGLEHCNQIFVRNLDRVMHGQLTPMALDGHASRLYTYKDLRSVSSHRGTDAYRRATYFGVFKLWYKKAHALAVTGNVNECV